jgi:hypothetical protein
LVETLYQKTKIKKEYCLQILKNYQFDLEKSFLYLSDLYKMGKIPKEYFDY